MPYREISFKDIQPLHIIGRAVDERKIFEQEDDCWRFIFQIFAANVGKPALNLWRNDIVKSAKSLLAGYDISPNFIVVEHEPLVSILDFSLVMTHYHFYLVPNVKECLPIFMKKLNGGFAKYFNLKHKRKGVLFGSRYKSIPVDTEFQSDAVSRYVSIINPLDLYQPDWREAGLKNKTEALEFLKNYPFSSFPDKTGLRKSKILASEETLKTYCSGSNLNKKDYGRFIDEFLNQKLFANNPFFVE